MATDQVNLGINGNSANAQQAWMALINVQKQMTEEIRRLGTEMAQTGKRGATSMNEAALSLDKMSKSLFALAGFGTIAGGVITSLNLMRREIEAIVNLQERIAGQEVEGAAALADVIQTLPANAVFRGRSYADKRAKIAINEQMRRETMAINTRLTPAERYAVVGESISAGTDPDYTQRFDAAIMAMQMFPEKNFVDISEMTKGLSRSLEINKLMPGETIRSRASTLQLALGFSPSGRQNQAEFFNNVVGRSTMLGQFGMNEQDQLALTTTLQYLMADTTGETAFTVAVRLAEQVFTEVAAGDTDSLRAARGKDFMTMLKAVSDDPKTGKRGRRRLLGAFDQFLSERERELFLSEATDEEIKGKLSLRARGIIPARQLIMQGDTPAKRKLAEAYEMIPIGEAAEREIAERLQAIRATPSLMPFNVDVPAKGATYRALGQPGTAVKQPLLDALDVISRVQGESAQVTKLRSYVERLSEANAEATFDRTIERMEQLINKSEQPRTMLERFLPSGGRQLQSWIDWGRQWAPDQLGYRMGRGLARRVVGDEVDDFMLPGFGVTRRGFDPEAGMFVRRQKGGDMTQNIEELIGSLRELSATLKAQRTTGPPVVGRGAAEAQE